jgi:hypothetical protein
MGRGAGIRGALILTVMAGVLLPWATVGSSAVSGSETHDGKTLLVTSLAALALSVAPRTRPVRTADTALAVFTFAFTLGESDDLVSLASRTGNSLTPGIGTGLILCMCAAGAWVAGLVWELSVVLGIRGRRGRHLSRRALVPRPVLLQDLPKSRPAIAGGNR